MRTWNEDQFLQMCILSGCDYLPSIPGLGLKSVSRSKPSLLIGPLPSSDQCAAFRDS